MKALVLTLILAVVPLSAQAGHLCLKHTDMVKLLRDKQNEVPRFVGLMGGGIMVAEIFISPDGTWTLVFTDRAGTACHMASGDDWHAVPVLGGGI